MLKQRGLLSAAVLLHTNPQVWRNEEKDEKDECAYCTEYTNPCEYSVEEAEHCKLTDVSARCSDNARAGKRANRLISSSLVTLFNIVPCWDKSVLSSWNGRIKICRQADALTEASWILMGFESNAWRQVEREQHEGTERWRLVALFRKHVHSHLCTNNFYRFCFGALV